MELGPLGMRCNGLRTVSGAEAADAAAELEALGYGTLWVSANNPPEGLEEHLSGLLRATRTLRVATGIASIWVHPAAPIAAMSARLNAEHGDRFVLGLGVSHAPLVAKLGAEYRRPLALMTRYLDELDAADLPVPAAARTLAALAPKMLAVARDRSLGTYTFLAPPLHTRWARGVLGSGPVLAVDVKMLLDTDPETARTAGRASFALNLALPNYQENLRRSGFDDAELVDGGSDRLVDAVVAWGGVAEAASLVAEHRAAGADHVVVEPVSSDPLPREAWRSFAAL
jgi:probable F420-dependent oxidoreductase